MHDLNEHILSGVCQQGPSHSTHADTIRHYKCSTCKETFTTQAEIYRHRKEEHTSNANLQPRPFESQDWDDNMESIYRINASHILAQPRHTDMISDFNFPTENLNRGAREINEHLADIHSLENNSYKVNISLGLILKHRETSELRYYIPYNNNTLFLRPRTISNDDDLARFMEEVEELNLIENSVRDASPDTKWFLAYIANIHITIYRTNFYLGAGLVPDYLKILSSLTSLDRDPTTRLEYNDNLCLFRAIFFSRTKEENNLHGIHELYSLWRRITQKTTLPEDPEEFEGITLEDLPSVEKALKINLYVVNRDRDGNKIVIYRSMRHHDETINLNQHGNHLSFINNLKIFGRKFLCETCGRHWKTAYLLHRHQPVCHTEPSFKYPGGFHRRPQTMFEKFRSFGLPVPHGNSRDYLRHLILNQFYLNKIKQKH